MSKESRKRLYLTGASGLLGRAIYQKFENEGWIVYGTALTRVSNSLHTVDITNNDAVRNTMNEFKPHFIIHAAAQRYPNMVDADLDAARNLNINGTNYIVKAAADLRVPVLYISTDYVFDGKGERPYTIEDVPSPINNYGQTKLEGEIITLKYPGNLVLRVPVLYGPVLSLNESAVTCLLEPLFTKSKTAYVSHLERRCPSHVDDIALICLQLANINLQNICQQGIFHWCGEEKMTKFQMTQKIGDIFDLPHAHIKPVMELGAGSTRPIDPELDCSRLKQLGFGKHTPFSKGIYDVLCSWVSLNCTNSLLKHN